MSPAFNVLVVAAFVAQVANYYLLGRGVINRYLFLFVLCCYIATESMLALEHPAMWLYVALNLWGVLCLWRKSPVRV